MESFLILYLFVGSVIGLYGIINDRELDRRIWIPMIAVWPFVAVFVTVMFALASVLVPVLALWKKLTWRSL